MHVRTERSGLSCVLTIGPGLRAETPSALEVTSHLESQRISQGLIDQDAIDALIKEAEADPGSEHEAVVAQGRPAIDGDHASFRIKPELAEAFEAIAARRKAAKDFLENGAPHPHEPAPGSDAGGEPSEPIDFHEVSAFVIVRKGDTLGEIINATDGVDGVDVTGRVISAKGGRSLRIETNDTTEAKGSTLIAAASGRLVWADPRIVVERTLSIAGDVDYTTGNIDFPGPVTIAGNIKDNFRVKVGQDLRVDQLVEAATVCSTRDTTLQRGMAGRGTGTLEVGRDLHAGYLDGVRAVVGRDCVVDREIKECDIEVRGTVKSPICAFYGGRLESLHPVTLGVVGSPAGVETRIEIGGVPQIERLVERLGDIIGTLGAERKRSADELKALNETIRKLTPAQAERLTELQFNQIRADELTEKIAEAAGELLDTVMALPPTRLTVQRALHRGTTIRLGTREMAVKESVPNPVSIDVDPSGKLRCFMNNSTEPTPIRGFAREVINDNDDPVRKLTEYANRVIAQSEAADEAA